MRRSKRAENDIFDFQRQLFYASNTVLNARAYAVNDVKVGLQSLSEHPDRAEHAVLSIDMIMLNDGMQESVLCRDAYLARVDFYILDVLLINLIAVFGQRHTAAVIEALKVRSGDGDENAPNHDVAFLFGIDHCFVHAFHRGFKINNLSLAHPA